MNLNIKVENKNTRYGYIRGRIGNYNWFALVHKTPINSGINPSTLKKGDGKITRLCLYKDVNIKDEKNNLSVRRYIYANYKREWDVLSRDHRYIVNKLVEYIERRYSLVVIK